jgi:myo-inositol-1(or 4)-monophosphatase
VLKQPQCLILILSETSHSVGDRLIAKFAKLKPERKNDGTLVTEADKWADLTIREAIKAKFPDHGVLTEETEHFFPARDWCWIVDPIDGTTNFTRGIAIWGISLGLLYQGTPVFGLVYLVWRIWFNRTRGSIFKWGVNSD